jgi:hypothetical protein
MPGTARNAASALRQSQNRTFSIANGKNRNHRRALDGATIDIRRPRDARARHRADEIDFALRNISGNTQLLAGMRRAWPSRTASRSDMHDRYWRVLNISVEFFETLATLGRSPHDTGWSHAHLASRSTGLALVYRGDFRGPSRQERVDLPALTTAI